MTKDEAMKLALEAAYLAGFNASGEGYNGEYPFRDHNAHPEQDAGWMRERDKHVEQALAEQPAPVQEPVAIHQVFIDGGWRDKEQSELWQYASELWKIRTLYTSPPAQRTWVGLTDEEKKDFWTADEMTQKEWDELFADIEAKLKEKNT